MKNYRDNYDSYYDDGPRGHKLHAKGAKKKFKGHQSKHSRPQIEEFEDDNLYESEPSSYATYKQVQDQSQPIYKKKENPTPITPSTPAQFVPNPDTTHTIRGNTIDLSRVANIEKVSNVRDGHETYGIKFLFSGKKGLFRIVWFNQNSTERDKVFATEYAFWKGVTNNASSIH